MILNSLPLAVFVLCILPGVISGSWFDYVCPSTDGLHSELEECKVSLMSYRQEIARIKEQLKELMDVIIALSKVNSENNEKISNMADVIPLKDFETLPKNNIKYQKLVSDNTELQKSYDELMEINRALQANRSDVEQKNWELTNYNANLQQRYKDLENTVKVLQTNHVNSQIRNRELAHENDHLMKDKAELQKQNGYLQEIYEELLINYQESLENSNSLLNITAQAEQEIEKVKEINDRFEGIIIASVVIILFAVSIGLLGWIKSVRR